MEVPDVAPQGMQNVDFAEGMDDAARNAAFDAAVANTPPTPAYSAFDAVADPPAVAYTPPTPADWPSNTSMNSDGLQHGNIISKKTHTTRITKMYHLIYYISRPSQKLNFISFIKILNFNDAFDG